MCSGFSVKDPNNPESIKKVLFPNPAASKFIQVIRKDGTETIAKWGRRNEQEEPINLPLGGWARSENMAAWKKYKPEKVYIPCFEFYEKGHSWPTNGHPIVGLLCTVGEYRVVYVITVAAPEVYQHIHDRMPMLGKGYDKRCC
jgi:putative SOS response-associated peptidase YedK